MKRTHAPAALVLAATAALLLSVTDAQARTVNDPGPITFTVTGGTISTPGDAISIPSGTLTGTVDNKGNIALPLAGITFEAAQTPAFAMELEAAGDGIGVIDPAKGTITLHLSLKLAAVGLFFPPGSCEIGPFAVTLTTGLSGTKEGTAYAQQSGHATLVDGTFPLPAAACGVLSPTIDGAAHLPSAAGENLLTLPVVAGGLMGTPINGN